MELDRAQRQSHAGTCLDLLVPVQGNCNPTEDKDFPYHCVLPALWQKFQEDPHGCDVRVSKRLWPYSIEELPNIFDSHWSWLPPNKIKNENKKIKKKRRTPNYASLLWIKLRLFPSVSIETWQPETSWWPAAGLWRSLTLVWHEISKMTLTMWWEEM